MQTTQLTTAIRRYHDLLTPAMAAETGGHLVDQHTRRNLYFGDRPLSSVLRPRMLTHEQYAFLSQSIRAITPAFNKAHNAAMADPQARAFLMPEDWEEELLKIDPGYEWPVPLSRMDTFYLPDQGVLSMTEYNAEVPAAPAYNEVLTEMFLGLPVMREFEKEYEIYPIPARHKTMHTLRGCYVQWAKNGGKSGSKPADPSQKPVIGILDWKEVPTYSEFVLFRDYFRSQGYTAIICDPRELSYKRGKLMARDLDTGNEVHINLVYKRVLIHELIEKMGVNNAVVRALRDKAACMVNPFQCKLMHKKASLAMLSDEQFAHLYSRNELKAIKQFIPWTRVVADRKTKVNGKTVDLPKFISQNKDQLVMKPNDDYGGKGVVLGWTVDQQAWDAALQAYLREPAIVQRRIPIPSEPYPSMVNGEMKIFDRMYDTAPYVWGMDYMSSCLSRLSTVDLLNVTSGGGSTVPVVVIEKR